jgi:phage replication initiation protein
MDERAAARASATVAAGDSPRTVIRGESAGNGTHQRPSAEPVRLLTDWINLSFPFDPEEGSVERFIQVFAEATAERFGGMTDRGRGLHGYSTSYQLDRGGVLFAYGGQRNTAFLSLSSEGCALIADWQRFIYLGRNQLAGRITRWDGAVDDFTGMHSVDLAVEMYRQGWFKTGGRQPSSKVAGDWLGQRQGRTLYIGNRHNGKLLRIYEKGKQLGDPDSPWTRWEIEYHNIDRVIPWEVLLFPDRYVAGAYPCMSWVGVDRSRLLTVKAQDEISYDRLVHAGSTAYGALINIMLEREGSPERVIAMLRKSGAPRRLAFSDEYLREHVNAPDV